MPERTAPAPAELRAALTRWGLDEAPRARLTGDVSPRQYHRVWLRGDATAVAMVTPLERLAQMHDWLAIRDWLARWQVPAPAVRATAPELGVVLLEDIGDRLLTQVTNADTADAWYRRTLEHLVRIEGALREEIGAVTPAHTRDLSEERLHWELRRFRKVVAAGARELDDAELAAWKAGEDALVATLRAAPSVWMHRDLHARNLLVHGREAVWIDFQDAMRGPWLYDLASLLLDPYAALEPDRREALRQFYLRHGTPRTRAVEPLWQACVVQRLAHCAACYVWVADQLGNDTYLRYLPFTFTHLRAALAACAPAAPLSRVMASRWDTLASRAAAPLASAPLSRRRPDQPQGALARV